MDRAQLAATLLTALLANPQARAGAAKYVRDRKLSGATVEKRLADLAVRHADALIERLKVTVKP